MNKLLLLVLISSVASHVYAEQDGAQQAREIITEKIKGLEKSKRLLYALQYAYLKCNETEPSPEESAEELFKQAKESLENPGKIAREALEANKNTPCQKLRTILEKCPSTGSIEADNSRCKLALLRFMESQESRKDLNGWIKDFEEALESE